TALRALASTVMTYAPTPQWQAGLQYVAYPAPELPVIDRISALHTFLDSELIPAQERLIKRLNSLNFGSRPIYFDNRLVYDSDSFVSSRDRYMRLGEPDRKALLAGVYASTSATYSLTSYWLGGFFDAMEEIGDKYGIGQKFRPDGASASQRFDILR